MLTRGCGAGQVGVDDAMPSHRGGRNGDTTSDVFQFCIYRWLIKSSLLATTPGEIHHSIHLALIISGSGSGGYMDENMLNKILNVLEAG